eukprot:CAMPEP_0197928840 /NCGR_PEP_ID=MMETSP1439-20131203/102973_1 /TAXON_ID=66791 /ORGANISM="Gonyaulax spinifera, Strain CCMP409" /LENGTH=139 /DNA_ID=CAMNT_0043551465 /DNA_START=96 /DNA_END=516 /DNA_ORIENTATION=-
MARAASWGQPAPGRQAARQMDSPAGPPLPWHECQLLPLAPSALQAAARAAGRPDKGLWPRGAPAAAKTTDHLHGRLTQGSLLIREVLARAILHVRSTIFWWPLAGLAGGGAAAARRGLVVGVRGRTASVLAEARAQGQG